MACTYKDIIGAADRCQYVKENCNKDFEFVNFVDVHFCSYDENLLIFIFSAIIILAFFFNMIATTAEDYLSPALSYLAKRFQFSQSLAGVTLLSFANGAPDVLIAFSAGGKESGITLAIGSIFGAGLFVMTFILWQVLIAAGGPVKVKGKNFIRDLSFYLFAVAIIFSFGYVGYINLWMTLAFMSTYVVFMIVVIFMELRQQGEKKKRKELAHEDDEMADDKHQLVHEPAKDTPSPESPPSPPSPEVKKKIMIITHPPRVTISTIKNEWDTISLPEKLYHIYLLPTFFVRDITIPLTDEEYYHREYAVLWPFLTPLFIFTVVGWKYINLIYYLPVAIVLAIIIFKAQDKTITEDYQIVFSFAGILGCVAWINLFANLLMDYLRLIEILTELPSAFLGMTLIAWGNAVADAMAIIALAKIGLSVMSVTGVYAGQLFNLVIGFGLMLVRQTYKEPKQFDLYNADTTEHMLTLIILIVAFLNIAQTLIYGIYNRYLIDLRWGYYLSAYYFLFCVLVFYIVFVMQRK
eukprot:TRINITY_DN2096_c0_g2_i1.p1 TRINITY_DN2096_c0_g2~~TRINITY_DN2096_c0_g2_i1.p1  ORF type:complete len:523 (+),score=92.18 TRINITY_DN2096_c0_g2_i1:61-1629(+)